MNKVFPAFGSALYFWRALTKPEIMVCRRLAALLLAVPLCGCVPARVPRIDLSGMTLPRFEMFRYGVREDDAAMTAYALTPSDVRAIKTQFETAFKDGRTLEFGPLSARQAANRDITVCGLVNVRRPTGTYTGMKLFEGLAKPAADPLDPLGSLRFTPRRIAGTNAKPLDIYSFCRDAGVL